MIDEDFSENILEKIAQIAKEKDKVAESDPSKFMFEGNVFDPLSKHEVEEEEEPPPPPVFSEEELAAAKASSFDEGKREGLTESQNSREQAVSETLNRISIALVTEFDAEKHREKIYEAEALALSLSIFETLFPVFTKDHGLTEIKTAITQVIQDESGQGKIRIELSPDETAPLTEHLTHLPIENGTERLNIVTNDTFTDGQFKLTWDDGGAVRDSQKMAGTVASILKQGLAGQPSSRHDNNENGTKDALPVDGNTEEPAENDETASDTTGDKT